MRIPNRAMIATRPFTIGQFGTVIDVKGHTVLVCSPDAPPCAFYSEPAIDGDPHYTCPKCGRLGLRMEEATPEQCGIS